MRPLLFLAAIAGLTAGFRHFLAYRDELNAPRKPGRRRIAPKRARRGSHARRPAA
jgi:hypothetical protein